MLDNKIYISGGSDGHSMYAHSSVECYNTDTNTWTLVANMNIARAGHGLVSLEGRLYAIGGYSTSTRYGHVDTVEVYIPEENSWNLLEQKLGCQLSSGSGINSDACLMKKYFL